MKNIKYAINSKCTQRITYLPGWALSIKGKIDSQKGRGVCDEYIRRLHRKQISLETQEVINTENALFDVRKEAAVILSGLEEQRRQWKEIPAKTTGSDVASIRMNRRNIQRANTIKTEIKKNIEKLTMLNERIINANTVLDERINQLRNNTAMKIHAYIQGMRCQKNDNYECDIMITDDSARQIYDEKHKELDQKIRTVVNLNMEVSEDVV